MKYIDTWSANKIAVLSLVPILGMWVLYKMGKNYGLKAFLVVFGISFGLSFVNLLIDPTTFDGLGFIVLLILPTVLQFFIVRSYARSYKMVKSLV